METPLTPLDFARRARKLHGAREAVVDGELRLTYAEFGERCDRWSAALAAARRAAGRPRRHDRAQHPSRISSSSTPFRRSARSIVPMNYRLTADDFVYLANHSGCRVLCVHAGLPRARRSRAQPHANASSTSSRSKASARAGSTTKRCSPRAAVTCSSRPGIAETDLLAINYTSGTTAQPEGRDDHAPQRLGELRWARSRTGR